MSNLRDYANGLFKPRADMPVWQWCEQNIHSVPMAEDDGPYSTTLYPYVRDVLECFRSRSVQDVVCIWGSQTSKTTTYSAGLMWTIVNDPTETMWAMDTGKNAEKFSKDRFSKMVKKCPPALARLGEARGDNNVMEKRFDQMSFYLIGSNSPGNLASQPAGRTIADEIDKWPDASKKEAASVKLIESRTKGRSVWQRFWSSTPTTKDGAIWKKWEESDKRYYMMPCPACGDPFKLETKGIMYSKDTRDEDGNLDLMDVKRSAFYLTPCCGHHLTDSEKLKSMREAYDMDGFGWVPTNVDKARPKMRGYHLHSLYSPVISFGDFAVEWVLSHADARSQQNFKNSWEAEPWEDRIVAIDPGKLKKLEGSHDRGDMVGRTRMLMVDVQRKDLRFNIRGYDPYSRLIDWGTLATWEDVEALQVKYNIEHVGVDTQFPDRQQEAFSAIFKNRAKGWFAIEGKGKGQGLFGKLYSSSRINPFVGERKKFVSGASKILYLQVNSEVWKADLARKRNAESPEWKVYRGIKGGYAKELYAEFQRVVLRRGKTVKEWHVKSHGQNHQFDLEYYQLAAAHFLKLPPYDGGQVRPIFEGDAASVFKPVAEVVQRDEEKPAGATDAEPEPMVFFKPVRDR